VKEFNDKGWLEALLAEELARHDPAAARGRLPPELIGPDMARSPTDLAPAARLLVNRSLRYRVRLGGTPTPADTFRDEVRQHVGVSLDLALLRGQPFVRARQRAEIAAFLAAAVGEEEIAIAVEPHEPGGESERAVERALRAAAERLHGRFFPPGDPVRGLPLHSGATGVLRRRLARVVMGYLREGRLQPEALARHRDYAARESALLAEALSGLLHAGGAPDDRDRAIRLRQLPRLGLPRAARKDARRAIETPRAPDVLAAAAPERVRPFLFEQLLLAQLLARLGGEAPARFIEAFALSAGLDPAVRVAAQVEAAAQHGDHEAWFQAFDEGGGPVDWQALADQWENAADQVVERVSHAVTGNIGAMVTELRETGELGTLLARAAGGHALTPEEKRKVKAQLIDLAKAVPALAIFAAPGGMLLLPLLAKLLPFSLMPSAWDKLPDAKNGAARLPAGAAPRAAPPAESRDPASATRKPGDPVA
jgi:hypothetical protein